MARGDNTQCRGAARPWIEFPGFFYLTAALGSYQRSFFFQPPAKAFDLFIQGIQLLLNITKDDISQQITEFDGM